MRWLAYAIGFVGLLPVYGQIEAVLPAGVPGILSIAIVPIFVFVVILMHELGHAAMARHVGADLIRIVVLPFAYDVRTGRFTTETPGRRGEVGGYVTYRLDRIDAVRKRMLIVAAGPAANLLFACVLVGIVTLIAPGTVTGIGASGADGGLPSDAEIYRQIAVLRAAHVWADAEHLFEMTAWLSVVVAVVNLLPFDGSDGAQLLTSARRRQSRRRSG